MNYRLIIPAAAALALAACNNTGDAGAEASTAATDSAMADAAATPAAGNAMATTAQGFVDTASASDKFEIEAGKLAQSMGKSQTVKDFGAMMVKDHTTSSADLKTAAATASGVTIAPKLSAMQQSNLDALKSAGAEFDAAYKTQQIEAHEQALALLKNYAASGDNAALKAFATKVAPTVETHLEKARGL